MIDSNIGLSSASFYPDMNTEDTIKVMSNIQFHMGEIFLNSPCEFTEDFAKLLKYKKEEHNFKINSIHAFSTLFEPYLFDIYNRRRKDMIECFKRVCKLANIVGAKCYTFHGMRLQNFNDLDMKFIVDIYNELNYIALENDVKLAQENVSWCMSSNLKFLKTLKDKCKYPIYFTFDIKQSYKANIKISEYLNIMKDRLVNFHINDRDLNHPCLIPGCGNIDYNLIKTKLYEINYKGPYIIEVYRDNYSKYDELTCGKDFLNKVFHYK